MRDRNGFVTRAASAGDALPNRWATHAVTYAALGSHARPSIPTPTGAAGHCRPLCSSQDPDLVGAHPSGIALVDKDLRYVGSNRRSRDHSLQP